MIRGTRNAVRYAHGGRLSVNNFDLLRFLFAGTVMLVHAHVLSGAPQLGFLAEWLSSDVAVRGFFVISGFLVFMSYENSRSFWNYAEKRIRRIYPAYICVVSGCALLLFFFSIQSAQNYFSLEFVKYLGANYVFLNFLHPTLPGVFETNPVPAVNGALWTLKIEVMFYASVPLFVWTFRRWGVLPIIIGVYIASVLYVWALESVATTTGSPLYRMLARQLPGQLSYFMGGAFFFYYFPLFEKHVHWFVLCAVIAAALSWSLPLDYLEPIWLATLVVFFGLFVYVGNFGKYGDLSYGTYILHFPILQALVHFGMFDRSPIAALVTACVIVLAGAFLLWRFVERPWLRRSSHYVVSVRP